MARFVRTTAMCLCLAVSHLSFAGDSNSSPVPEINVDTQGYIHGSIVVPVPRSEVRHFLEDPVQAGTLSTDVYKTHATPQGACEVITREIRGIWSPITYKALRCPTTLGWTENLVHSDSISAYSTEWTLQGVEGGTKVRYRVKTRFSSSLIPPSLVQGETKRSVRRMLQNLFRKITKGKTK